jgi:hypothetical protein
MTYQLMAETQDSVGGATLQAILAIAWARWKAISRRGKFL